MLYQQQLRKERRSLSNINTLEQTDEMLITLFSWFAQAESESISKNVTWGIRRSFEQGNFSMHYSTTLGYEKGEDGEPKIVPEEAETIRMIYSMFLDGSSYRDIAKSLAEQGRKKTSGKHTIKIQFKGGYETVQTLD